MSNLGFTWKRYWRRTDSWVFHCFVKIDRRSGFISLCGKHRIRESGGQSSNRPEAARRCSKCDVMEMRGCKKDQSLSQNDRQKEKP